MLAGLLAAALTLLSPGAQAWAAAAKTTAPTGIVLPTGPLTGIQTGKIQTPFPPVIASGQVVPSLSVTALPTAKAAAAQANAPATAMAASQAKLAALDLKPLAQPAASAESVSAVGAGLEAVLTGRTAASGSSALPVAGSAGAANSNLSPFFGSGNGSRRDGPPPQLLRERIEKASRGPRLAKAFWTAVSYAGPVAAFAALTAKAGLFGLVSWTSLAAVAILFVGLVIEVKKRGGATEALDPVVHREAHEGIKDLSRRAGIPVPGLLRWELPFPNAAASGSPGAATVQVTPMLLRYLKPAQLVGVLAHELSHVLHRDTRRAMAMGLTGTLLTLSLLNLHVSLPLFVGVMSAHKLAQAAVHRSMERLADLGAAKLTGQPAELGAGLIRIDFWARLMKGKLDAVGTPGFSDLADGHPGVLRRAEALARLIDPASPTKLGGRGSLKAFYPSAVSFLSLIAKPLLLGTTLLLLPWYLWPAMLAARKYVKVGLAKLKAAGDTAGVTRDRLRAYLDHPSDLIGDWARDARHLALRLKPAPGDDAQRRRLSELP
jgi:Zn-dependent protease with chaperone function